MRWPSPRPNSRAMQEQINRIERKVDNIMSEQSQQQADIDAATTAISDENTAISAVASDLESAVANIAAEIDTLKQANPAVDTTALDAAVGSLSAPLAALQSAGTSVDALETPAPDAPSAA